LTGYAILWDNWYMVVGKAQGAEMEEQFVRRMKVLREVQRISQGDMAARMVHAGWEYWRQTTVSRVEKFERNVRLAEAHDIAHILGLPLAEMLTLSDEVQNQSLGAAERRRELDDWIGRLDESIATFTAQLEQFRTTLHQEDTPQEGRKAPLARAGEESTRVLRIQYRDDDLTKAEVRDGINPEA
jgi:transcriptional regulator with XRE-family HTH domain